MIKLFKFCVRCVLLAVALLASSAVHAANTQSFGFWNQDVAMGNMGFVNPDLKNIRWWVEGQARVFDQLSKVSVGLARTAVGYTLLDDGKYNVAFWGGYTWNPSRLDGKRDVNESDIFPALTYSANTDFGRISGRSMTDVRFTDTDTNKGGGRIGFRYRQQVRIDYRLTSIDPRLSLIGWDEVMFNINNTNWGQRTGIDQNRVFAGMGWNFTPNVRMETGYFNWFINTHTPHLGTDTVRHMLAVSLNASF